MIISPNAIIAAMAASHAGPIIRRLDGSEHGQRGVAGEKEVVAHRVSHQQRRETRISPNHPRWRRQRAEALADLPQAEDDEHRQKRRKRGAENRHADQRETKQIDEDRDS